jgi:hypothetical protein
LANPDYPTELVWSAPFSARDSRLEQNPVYRDPVYPGTTVRSNFDNHKFPCLRLLGP